MSCDADFIRANGCQKHGIGQAFLLVTDLSHAHVMG